MFIRTLLFATIALSLAPAGTALAQKRDLKDELGWIVVLGIETYMPKAVGVSIGGVTVAAKRESEKCEKFEVWQNGDFAVIGSCRYVYRRNIPTQGTKKLFNEKVTVELTGNYKRGHVNVQLHAGAAQGLINLSGITHAWKRHILGKAREMDTAYYWYRNLTPTQYQGVFTSAVHRGYEPARILVRPDGHGDIRIDLRIRPQDGKPFVAKHHLTEQQFNAEHQQRSQQGFGMPIHYRYRVHGQWRHLALWKR